MFRTPRRSAAGTAGPPELLQRPAVQLTSGHFPANAAWLALAAICHNLTRRDRPALTAVAARLDRWLGGHLAELEKAEPSMPREDRAADTWEPLVAVADLAGGLWPGLARDAAVTLTADQDSEARTSDGIRLLADIRAAFAALSNPKPPPPKTCSKR